MNNKVGYKCKWCDEKFTDKRKAERHAVICGMTIEMVRSKKGKPMSHCEKCLKNTVDVKKLGGIVCSQCRKIKRLPNEITVKQINTAIKMFENNEINYYGTEI